MEEDGPLLPEIRSELLAYGATGGTENANINEDPLGYMTTSGEPSLQHNPCRVWRKGTYGFGISFLRMATILLWRGAMPVYGLQNVLTVILLLVSIGASIMQYKFVGYPALLQRSMRSYDKEEFYYTVLSFSGVVFALAVFNSMFKLVSNSVKTLYRCNITLYIHSIYFQDYMYYELTFPEEDGVRAIDNPDQRIVRDIDSWSQNMLSILFKIWSVFLTLAAILLAMSLVLSWFSLVPLMILLVGAFVSMILLRPLVRVRYVQEWLEGDFRRSHVHILENAESIAFSRGGVDNERAQVDRTLFRAVANQIMYWVVSFPYDLWSNLFNWGKYTVGFILPGIIIFLFQQETDIDEFITAGVGTMQLMDNLKEILQIVDYLPDVAGYTARLGDIIHYASVKRKSFKKAREIERRNASREYGEIEVEIAERSARMRYIQGEGAPFAHAGDDDAIELDNVSIFAPTQHGRGTDVLVAGLSITIREGEHLLVSGENGTGKTTLLRCMAGIWPWVEGSVSLAGSCLFIPQRPYFRFESLRNQLLYPDRADSIYGQDMKARVLEIVREIAMLVPPATIDLLHDAGNESKELDERLRQCLEMAGLEKYAGSLNHILDWNEALSGGEKQRLMFARLFFRRPRFAILDESTSALTEDGESEMYRKCKQIGTTLVSVGHRAQLVRFHHVRLTVGLGTGAEYRIESL